MSRNRVMCEIDELGSPIRIFRVASAALAFPPEKVREFPRREAVGSIRLQVYNRDDKSCVRCGKPLTFYQMHMHERKAKGTGGEVSLANCWAMCYDCHEKPNGFSEHGNRRWGGRAR